MQQSFCVHDLGNMKLLGILIVLLFITACTQNAIIPEEDTFLPNSNEYFAFKIDMIIGQEDSYSTDSNVVYVDELFSINVYIQNIGTVDLEPMQSRVYISRVTNPGVFGLQSLHELSTRVNETIMAKETQIISFSDLLINTKIMKESSGKIEANFCYIPYEGAKEKCHVRREIYSVIER